MPDRELWRFVNSFAPWLSAVGTFAAVATSLYFSRSDRRIYLRARASVRIRAIRGGGAGHGARFVSVNVTNHGRRSARVLLVVFKVASIRGAFLAPDHQGSNLPIKLEDGDEAGFLYPIEEFFSAMLEALPCESVFPFPGLRFRFSKAVLSVATGKNVQARFDADLRREFVRRYRDARDKARSSGSDA